MAFQAGAAARIGPEPAPAYISAELTSGGNAAKFIDYPSNRRYPTVFTAARVRQLSSGDSYETHICGETGEESPQCGKRGGIQPGLPQLLQRHRGVAGRQPGEVLGAGVAVAVACRPLAQQGEEALVSEPAAQQVQSERTTLVHPVVEHVGRPGI